jgi:biotin carboxyl carrier protein
MKLHAKLSESDYEVSLKFRDDTAVVDLNGRHYEIGARPLAFGEYLIKSGTNIYKCRVEQNRSGLSAGGSFAVVVRGHSFDVTVIDPKRLRSGQSFGVQHTGAAEIVSPMPGKIVRILVKQGAHVEADAGIVVVEAMKMQNEMKAPKAGVVVSINAEEGATVSAGDVLAVIE